MTTKKPGKKSRNNIKNNATELESLASSMPAESSCVNFPVVGIGASAGGYEACSQLLSHLPLDSGMAFVIVQHLHPAHDSALSELLGRATKMPVTEIGDGILVQPNQVYVIPPNAELEIFHGKLQLSIRTNEIPHLPIDHFFRSLALDLGFKAIGVILSGTASDGVLGLKAIKAEGGITFSQDEASAKYAGMPHSAIAAGCVDMALPPDKIARELVYIAHHPYVQLAQSGQYELNKKNLLASKDELTKLFLLLRKVTGIDFTYYKMTTLQRRINRRMMLHKFEKISDYIEYMQAHIDEVDALYQDILINVTEFFRDPEAFDALRQDIFPRIIGMGTPNETLRIWIPGCSTGEEVYSMAMVILEYLDKLSPMNIQIFASDIDDQAIEKARQGIYRESITENVSSQRLQRFFNKIDGGYQIKKNIRDFCIFAKQNVFKDPPFSKIDLISCRNMLIYLGPVLQKKILTIFHYALVPNGVLFLGSAETVGEHTQLFKMIDQKYKFYGKKSLATPLHFDFSAPIIAMDVESDVSNVSNQPEIYERWNSTDLQQKADRMIMQKYAPAAVVVDEQMQILQFRGHTGRYLEPAPGEASLNIIKMVREGLLLYLRSLLQRSMEQHIFVRKEKLQYSYEDKLEYVNIEITPIQHPVESEYGYLIVFEETQSTLIESIGSIYTVDNKKKNETLAGDKNKTIEAKQYLVLSQELAATKEYLQSVIEQQEASNEELRSANEEIQSSNEELQSINEELETAKEELQSTNEELATVNEELETRNLQLARLNDDYSNFINSLNIAFLTVDNHLLIRDFTPQTKKMMNIVDSDLGRSISDIKLRIQLPQLEKMILECMEEVKNIEFEFQNEKGRWYSVRLRPYRTSDSQIDGAVIAFLDVNDIKAALSKATAALDYTESIIYAIHHPLLVLDENLRVVSASQAYFDVFQVTEKETVGNLIYRLGNGEWAIPSLREKLEITLMKGEAFDDFAVEHKFEKIGLNSVQIFGRQIKRKKPEMHMILMQIEVADKEQL